MQLARQAQLHRTVRDRNRPRSCSTPLSALARVSATAPLKVAPNCPQLSPITCRSSNNISTAAASATGTVATSLTMDASLLQSEVFLGAARVTAAYAIMFASLIIWQGMSKLRLAAACAKTKEKFDRYNDRRMLPYDRTVGNLLEWAVPFLCLFWLSMIVTNGATLKWGWFYVAARAAYPVLAVQGKGIDAWGAQAPILLSTVPGYVCIIAFIIPTVRALL